MIKKDEDANLPIDLKSPFMTFLQNIILWLIKGLAALMILVVIWSSINVVLTLYLKSKDFYHLLLDIDEILTIFGSFLVVLIAIEIFINIILYLKKDMNHLKLVVATALMAIARKVIILDYDQIPEYHMFGMGALILSLAIAYWLISRTPHGRTTIFHRNEDSSQA